MERVKTALKGKITQQEKDALIRVADLMGEISLEMDAVDFYSQVDKGVYCLASEWAYIDEFLSSLIENCDIVEGD